MDRLVDTVNRKKKNIRIVALSIPDGQSGHNANFSLGYAIYFENSKTVADWIDIQVLISQENRQLLYRETLNHLNETGTAVFRTLEQAENTLSTLEKSVKPRS